jgi:hypothetical protein
MRRAPKQLLLWTVGLLVGGVAVAGLVVVAGHAAAASPAPPLPSPGSSPSPSPPGSSARASSFVPTGGSVITPFPTSVDARQGILTVTLTPNQPAAPVALGQQVGKTIVVQLPRGASWAGPSGSTGRSDAVSWVQAGPVTFTFDWYDASGAAQSNTISTYASA